MRRVWIPVLCLACLAVGLVGGYAGTALLTRPAPPARLPSAVFAKEEAKEYDIPGGKVALYPHSPTGRLSCAVVVQDGRYPEKGRKVNTVCTEALYLIEGAFTVWLGDLKKEVVAGDVVYITPGTPYSIEGKGKVFVFIEPEWDSKQNVPAD